MSAIPDLEQPVAGEPAWHRAARDALALAPDPQTAKTLAARVLAACPAEALARAAAPDPERPGEVLLALVGIAPFFGAYLERRPEWLLDLFADDLAPRTPSALREGAVQALADDEDPLDALRRFKYRELARITVRECNPERVPLARVGETLLELSALADALLAGALTSAEAAVARRHGPPRWKGESGDLGLAFCVLGLGKLGAEELNFSSDVDLVYVFEAPLEEVVLGDGAGYATLLPVEYFSTVAQTFGRLVASRTAEGFLYRVDLDLRPEGAQGPIVVSADAIAVYFEVWAQAWEKAAYMKARPVAGDRRLGERAIDAIAPMIYRSSVDSASVDAIRSLKERIAREHAEDPLCFDVKLDTGGIRDVEFVAQAMQLLHGGRIPEVRARGTEEALARVGEARLLPAARVAELLDAYRFLRRLEHRVQMEEERQTHDVPTDAAARTRIARAMGFVEPGAERSRFDAALAERRAGVRRAFADFLVERGGARVFTLLAQQVPHLVAADPSRRMLHELSEAFEREIDASSDPERALDNLGEFVRGVGKRRFYYELLLDRPELVARLTRLFAGSKYLSAILARHPRLIEPVFADPAVLLLSRDELRVDLAGIEADGRSADGGEDEALLAALRLFRHRQVLNVGLLDVDAKIDRREASRGLTDVAETCIERALSDALAWLPRRRPDALPWLERTRFCVVGMGTLASRELAYGSDLDLVFVFEQAPADSEHIAEIQEAYTRVVQRVISLLSTSTAQGRCYEVDTRLRPSGSQGSLVCSFDAFARYHADPADFWERQALLRARPVAGDVELGERFDTLRIEILSRPVPPDAAKQVGAVRARMEHELARETSSRRHVKLGRGGTLDVEAVVQLLQLRHGPTHAELLLPDPLDVQLARLGRLGHLSPERTAALVEGWDFLQHLSSRLRLVDDRSISDLDSERGDLDGLARRLGFPAGEREGDARRALLAAYEEHSERIRAVYREVIGAP